MLCGQSMQCLFSLFSTIKKVMTKQIFSNKHMPDARVNACLHYGMNYDYGNVMYAIDKKTNLKIDQNTKLSHLDIEKLNYYYPRICT